jgi:hypothetical protein
VNNADGSNADVAMKCTSSNDPCSLNCPSGCVTGTIKYGISSNYSVNTFPTPSCASYQNAITVPPSRTISPGCYDTLNLNDVNGSHGTATLTAGDYVIKYLNLNDTSTSAKLYIDDTNGPVRLFVPDSGSVSPNSPVVVKSGNPANFWLIYNGSSDVNNNTGNNFTGVIFAPAAKVNVDYQINGAVVGGMVNLTGTAVVHFNNALKCP